MTLSKTRFREEREVGTCDFTRCAAFYVLLLSLCCRGPCSRHRFHRLFALAVIILFVEVFLF